MLNSDGAWLECVMSNKHLDNGLEMALHIDVMSPRTQVQK